MIKREKIDKIILSSTNRYPLMKHWFDALDIAREFDKWLEDISNKHNWDKDDMQFLIKQFLMCEVEE